MEPANATSMVELEREEKSCERDLSIGPVYGRGDLIEFMRRNFLRNSIVDSSSWPLDQRLPDVAPRKKAAEQSRMMKSLYEAPLMHFVFRQSSFHQLCNILH